ncbi:MAG: GNAT family N-acetyltransferase [Actinomycetota bacterium]|nr:GNAT family N-acetyltransferase [Actinomycetota bacterium]
MSGTPMRPTVQVRDLRPAELPEAVGVLARGMRDNPVHVAAFGPDPERRRRALTRLFGGLFRVMTAQSPLCALDEAGTMVGTTGVFPVGTCRVTVGKRLRFMPVLVPLGPATLWRVTTWLDAWARRDPDEPHSHLGPLAVDAHLQGHGIGSQIMREYCARLDAGGELGYLETDKAANVRFYERFGYSVMDEAEVLGTPNWFMQRPPRVRLAA